MQTPHPVRIHIHGQHRVSRLTHLGRHIRISLIHYPAQNHQRKRKYTSEQNTLYDRSLHVLIIPLATVTVQPSANCSLKFQNPVLIHMALFINLTAQKHLDKFRDPFQVLLCLPHIPGLF